MAMQDRNVHKDAKFVRKSIDATLLAPGSADVDIPVFVTQPRYNFRLSDMSVFASVVGTAAAIIKACVVKLNGVAGTPLFGAAAATTFTIEDAWQNQAGVMAALGATAAQAFTGAETVIDGSWGVWTVQVDDSQVITTKAPSVTMAYPTEAAALQAAPPPDVGQGVVGILTVEAVGADFVAGTDNTNGANAFNTASRDGHVANLGVSASYQQANAVLGTKLNDDAGDRILDGRGNTDLLVVTARSAGAATFTNAHATVDFRPFPLQGEGRPSLSATQTNPLQVP